MLMEKNDMYDEFNHFLQESNKILVEVCLRFTDRQPDNVRDLYQDIVLSLWESWPSFRGESSRTTWVYRIAVNTATSALRRQATERQFVAIDQQMLESLAEEVKDERIAILYTIIDRLPVLDRAIFYLYLDNLSNRQIADILGRSERAVKQKIHRIKNKIRKDYELITRI